MKHIRFIQFIFCVNIINERLKHLDNLIVNLRNKLAKSGDTPSMNVSSSSTEVFLTVENYRELYGRIWRLHKMVNDYFGMTILLNTVIMNKIKDL